MKENNCKNKKCKRVLPEGYKHRYCENCRNDHAKNIENTGKGVLSVALLVGVTAITIITKGKINPNGKA